MIIQTLVNPLDSLERQNEKLQRIATALMRRVEESTNSSGAAYTQFQRAAMLEQEVRTRTHQLERTLELLNESNARLGQANRETEAARKDISNAIETIKEGFALFNAEDRLVMFNSRFGMHMPDIRGRLKQGLGFGEYVNLASGSKHLSLANSETREDWLRKRVNQHEFSHVVFNVSMTHDRWVQVSEHRTRDGGTVIMQTDITDIMRIERMERDRLRDDQARLISATLEHLDLGLCIFDSKFRLVGWNQRVSELLAIPTSRFQMGVNFDKLFRQLRKDFTLQDGIKLKDLYKWTRSKNGRSPLAFELRGGGNSILSVSARDMPDGGFVISFTDVTSERQATKALHNANEMLEQRVASRTEELAAALDDAKRANASKSRFVAAASHDLLQPLSAAKLYIASLGRETGNDKATRQIAEKAESALASVEHILQALLDISKLDSGLASVQIAGVPLQVIFEQLSDSFKPVADAKGLDIRIVPSTAIVSSDATYLRRILQNLISNAIRYTDTGRVLVGVRKKARTARIEIWDTGIGIPREKQNDVFQEFMRLNADASAAEGMGLGLAIVERASKLLGHPLKLVSTEGRGTRFSVEVPLAPHTLEEDGATKSIYPEKFNDLQNLIVLLIENDPNLRNALTMTMEHWGVQVIDCPDRTEAVGILREIGVSPDVIVADYQLDNDELGIEVINEIRKEFGAISACIISAIRTSDLSASCAESGLEFIQKPIDAKRLMAFLKSSPLQQPLP